MSLNLNTVAKCTLGCLLGRIRRWNLGCIRRYGGTRRWKVLLISVNWREFQWNVIIKCQNRWKKCAIRSISRPHQRHTHMNTHRITKYAIFINTLFHKTTSNPIFETEHAKVIEQRRNHYREQCKVFLEVQHWLPPPKILNKSERIQIGGKNRIQPSKVVLGRHESSFQFSCPRSRVVESSENTSTGTDWHWHWVRHRVNTG